MFQVVTNLMRPRARRRCHRRSLGMLGHTSTVTIHSHQTHPGVSTPHRLCLGMKGTPKNTSKATFWEETQWGPVYSQVNSKFVQDVKSWKCRANQTGTGLKGRFCKVHILRSTTTPRCCLADILQLRPGEAGLSCDICRRRNGTNRSKSCFMNAYHLPHTWQNHVNHAKSATSWMVRVEVYTHAVGAVWISNMFWVFSPTSVLYAFAFMNIIIW